MPTRWTQEDYVAGVKKIHGLKIKVLGRYVNNSTGVAVKCTTCKHIWSPMPRDVIHAQSGCPICYRTFYVSPHTKTHETYVAELREINPLIECVETNTRSAVKILHRCLRCKHEWKITPNNTIFKHGC